MKFLVRVLYFVLIGWWLAILWSLMAYIFCVSIVAMPVGVMMFNRIPLILTLKPVYQENVYYRTDTGDEVKVARRELPMVIRIIYFILLGWELTGIWVIISLILCLTIVGMPLGITMLNHVPLVLTLKQRY